MLFVYNHNNNILICLELTHYVFIFILCMYSDIIAGDKNGYIGNESHFLSSLFQLSKLVTLTLNNNVVSSSVLFQFYPSLLTSDIAGFDYDRIDEFNKLNNSNVKLYPVKLATVVRYALENGFEFVDFGPTTATTKVQIVCKPVKLIGAIYCNSKILRAFSLLAALFARNTHNHH